MSLQSWSQLPQSCLKIFSELTLLCIRTKQTKELSITSSFLLSCKRCSKWHQLPWHPTQLCVKKQLISVLRFLAYSWFRSLTAEFEATVPVYYQLWFDFQTLLQTKNWENWSQVSVLATRLELPRPIQSKTRGLVGQSPNFPAQM